MSADNIHFFIHLRDQIKLYHWHTQVYARHIATDKAIADLDRLIDSYVEIYIGKYGRKKLNATHGTMHIANLTEPGAVRFIKAAIRYTESTLIKGLNKERDTDLINIRDEIIAALNQLLYLFTLH